ncbi:MAG: FecR domain-containing protein [Gammaproteobacteria bacterium]
MTLDEIISDAMAARATEWWSLQRDGQLSQRERNEFLAWLRESPLHVEAYLRVTMSAQALAGACHGWTESAATLLEKAAADRGAEIVRVEAMQERAPAARARRSAPRWPGLRISFAAASLALIGTCIAWLTRDQWLVTSQTYRTAHAEQRSWRLPDGSVLHLNSDSAVVLRYSASERLAVLERGQAMFQVAKDGGRRFRADARDAQVIAVGTEFDVDRHLGATRVTVLEGRVAVVPGSAMPRSDTPLLAIPHATMVDGGKQLEVGARPASPQPIDVRSARAWTRQQIVFDGTPLGAVVDEFNRYAQVPMRVADASLKSMPVTGVFSAYDIESFVIFLRHLDNVEVEATPSRILIRMRSGPLTTPLSSVDDEAGTARAEGVR